MSYQVIARKWRPQNFDEVSGQAHVTTPLRNALRQDRVPHAILLSGPRGVGKTTLARILARCLNCDKGPTETPCGACNVCEEIAAGRSTDVQEIDAASRTSVDDVRELIEAVRYAPSPGKHRIYVVDEVHMLSTAAFNALLKTLEEPPPRTLFLFATTNPEKIPFTVTSRCQRYELRRLPTAEIADRLKEIARSEKLKISDSSLLAIAREGEGSMRDAMTLLDQIATFGSGEVSDEQVVEILDLIDRRLLLAIAKACLDGDAAAALTATCEAARAGSEAKRLGTELLRLLRDLVALKIAPKEEGLVEASDGEIAELRELAQGSDAARLRRMFRALLKEQEDLAWAPDPQAVLEMAIVRLASMPAGDDVAQLLARLDHLEKRLRGEDPGNPGGNAGGSGPSPSPPAARPASTPKPAVSTSSSGTPFERFRSALKEADRGLFAALEGGRIERGEGALLSVQVPKAFVAARLESRRPALEQAAEQCFGTGLRLEITHGEGEAASAAKPPSADTEQDRQRRQAALEHPAINSAREMLGAEIVDIKPLQS